MSSSNRLIVAILVVAALAVGFWVVLLSPKREEADKLSAEVETLEATLAQASSSLAAAEVAKEAFPGNYRQLVVLGEAVPEGDETASLLVEINRIAKASEVRFENIELNSAGGEGTAEAVAPPPVESSPAPESASGGVPAAATVPPTEAAASLMPLGASIGPAGLGVMPYSLTFTGDFFEIADFIEGVDELVATHNAKVGVEGRLVTVNGFALSPTGNEEQDLNVNFMVTTFVTPPEQGLTAGASPSEPAPVSTEPAGGEEGSEEAGTAQ